MLPALVHSATALCLIVELNRRQDEQDSDHREPPWRRGLRLGAGPPPSAHAAQVQVRSGALLLALFLITQLRTDLSRLADPREACNVLLVMCVLFIPLLLAPALAPAWWERHRSLMFAGVRLGFFSLSNIRNPRAVSYVLQQAEPGQSWVGLLRDAWRLLLGTRTLGLFVAPLFAPTPVLLSALLSGYAVMRCGNTEEMCGKPFLRHPVWVQRISRVHRELEVLHMLLRALDPFWSMFWCASSGSLLLQSDSRDSAANCRTFLTFVQLLFGLVVPTLLMARLHVHSKEVGAPESSVSSGGGAGSRPANHPQGSTFRRLHGWMRLCRACLRRLATVVEDWLLRLCAILNRQTGSRLMSACAWTTMLSLVYITSLCLEP